MTHASDERPRLKKFRLELIRLIPPNDKASLQHMMAKSLRDVLLDYLNWASRYVAPRPRTVMIEVEAQTDPRWVRMQSGRSGWQRTSKEFRSTPWLTRPRRPIGWEPRCRCRTGRSMSWSFS